MDISQYLEIFLDESKEHLQNLNEQILILEKEPENTDTINEIFRAAHSLKGMAGTMGFKRMQRLTHDMENVFSEVRNGKLKVTAGMVDVLFQCLDAIEGYISIIQETADEGTEDNEAIIKELNDTLAGKEDGDPMVSDSEPAKEKEPAKEDKQAVDLSNIVVSEYEKHAFDEVTEKGLNVYSIVVHVDETCVLKAARAFLVFKALEECGEIVKSVPSTQDIEDEKFDFDFSVFFITSEKLEDVLAKIKEVSEIKSAEGVVIDSKTVKVEGEEKAEEKHEETKPAATQAKETKPAAKTAQTGKPAASKPVVNRSVRVDIEKLDVLMNLVSELIIAKNGLVSVSASDSAHNTQGFNEQIEYLERVTTNLHESVMKVRMVPIESVVNRFPRMIRDLSKKLNKKMELYMSGEDTELDRTVIDEIGDPLMHLLRNSADHGLESAEIRAERGKPEVGSIFLDAYQDGNNVVIEVRDDGNGIDIEKVRNKAIEKGTITPEQAEGMSDKEIVDLLFKPSFSTAEKISDVSGRGVGLDVVKTKIEALGGDVEVKTTYGEGSTFIIRLPLTLAIIQALMVEVGNEKYAISLGSIQTIEDVPVSDIKYVQTKEVIHLRGTVIPLIRLADVLDVPDKKEDGESLTVVIVTKGDKQAGIVVDSLIGQQEIVIKSLGKFININKIISGATILGDGEVALIVDANVLV
ncbi:MAG: chemotaxis protein CheA [Lachnospiraceae bacterium]|nr:chemotaxis protein CheA [Lachnospiraceae bacterium]